MTDFVAQLSIGAWVEIHLSMESASFVIGCQCEKVCKSRLAIGTAVHKYTTIPHPCKNFMTFEIFQVGRISVVILIRTDTTLDHSQEAEKV